MILIVDGKYNQEDFIIYLYKRIKQIILSKLNVNLLYDYYDDIINNLYVKELNGKKIYSFDIINYEISHLKNINFGSYSVIKLDNIVYFSGTNIKLNDVCELINYGNIVIRHYPIISETFQDIQKNIELYYEEFQNGLGDIII